MARPSPEQIDSQSFGGLDIEVLEATGVYYLTYQNRPVSLRHRYYTTTGSKFKYPKTAFNNPAHCRNLAQRLNMQFNTTEFGMACIDL
jgi:hypothetical protein